MRQINVYTKTKKFQKIEWIVGYLFFLFILNIYGKMDHKMLHNASSLDLSSIILFWKKSRKIYNVNWIDIESIWNLIFPCFTGESFKSNKIGSGYF